ncbi:MAG: glycosyltransferase [Deltaproteobacteria bacterium]|nr:glycosyltransferase [Deltaproteobacteria bacterium]
MRRKPPRVSIGLPVYNGENFVEDAIRSILAEYYSNIELIISDNASTDRTEEICRDYAARDGRIRYLRNERNLGAAPNYNRTFHEARGEYFRWAAHDDMTEPEFLARCVEALDSDPSVVLAHTRVRIVDQRGNKVEDYDYRPNTSAPDPCKRFFDLLFVKNNCFEFFGLNRRDVLAQTQLHGTYPVGDRVTLSELAFRGRFFEHPEPLFLSREHPDRSVRRHVSQQERAAWFDASRANAITFPEWRAFWEYCKAIDRSPLSARDKTRCYLYMVKWLRHYRKRMRRDVYVACLDMASRRLGSRIAGPLWDLADRLGLTEEDI